MAKYLKYRFLSCVIPGDPEDETFAQQVFLSKKLPWSEANELLAKEEAAGGSYTVEDDGKPEELTLPIDKRMEVVEKAIQNIPGLITAAIKAAFGKDI